MDAVPAVSDLLDTAVHGLWLAIKHMDTMPGEASMNFMGALALGDRLPYMSPVSEPELYM